MAIDDPKAAFEQHYPSEDELNPTNIALSAAQLAFPHAALPLKVIQQVLKRFEEPSIRDRLSALTNLLWMEVKHLDTTKANIEDVKEAMQFAMRRDAEEFNDKKRDRYIKLIGNALRNDTQVQDVMTFVHIIEQLGERDMTVLKVINKVMNKEGDWKAHPNPGHRGQVMKVHPNVFTERAQELSVQIAIALGQRTDVNIFSREEGYMLCSRLHGFGLTHEVTDPSSREVPQGNYSFRLSVQGIRLLKLLGEHVPNFERYCDGL